jgi:hypothetical protein
MTGHGIWGHIPSICGHITVYDGICQGVRIPDGGPATESASERGRTERPWLGLDSVRLRRRHCRRAHTRSQPAKAAAAAVAAAAAEGGPSRHPGHSWHGWYSGGTRHAAAARLRPILYYISESVYIFVWVKIKPATTCHFGL